MGRGTQGLSENGTLEFQVWVEGLDFWLQLRAMFVSAATAHSRASGRFLSSLRNSWHLTSSIASRRSAGWGRGQAGLCSKNLEFLNFFFFLSSRRLRDWHRWRGPVQAARSLRVAQGQIDSGGLGQSPKRAASRVRPSEVGFRSPCAASCIFISSGHFVCRLTSDAKSRAPIKALRNKGAACLGAGPPGAVPPSPL